MRLIFCKILLTCFVSLLSVYRLQAQDHVKQKAVLKKAFANMMKDSCFFHANCGFLMIDSENGETIVEENAQKNIYPASNTKLFSTALALQVLGKDHFQYSRLYYDGTIQKDSTLIGNIIIDGNFNPCLGSSTIQHAERKQDFLKKLTDAVAKAGIKKIKGSVFAMESPIWKTRYSSWMLEDILFPYGCAVSQSGCFDNSFKLKATLPLLGSDTTGIISVYPSIPNTLFFNHIKNDSSKKTELDANNESEIAQNSKFVIIGNIKKSKDTATLQLAQPNPAYNTAFLLTNALENSKIKVEKGAGICYDLSLKATKIDSISSLSIGEIVKLTNLHSNNLFAELLLRMAAQHSGYNDKDLGKFLIDYWTSHGIDTKGMVIADGSGISRLDAINAKQIVDLLKIMHQSNLSDTYFASLPEAGVSGTLKHFGKGTALENHLFAKTGSATGIQCYSGYIKTKTGKLLIFSLLINQFAGQRATMRHKLEVFFNQTINY